jgi:hypothetical protein
VDTKATTRCRTSHGIGIKPTLNLKGKNDMRKFVLTNLVLGSLGLTVFSSAPLTGTVAHQAHEMACNETAVNAMDADIQSMPDGQAKTAATKEMGMAKDMMGKKDMESCGAHMQNAMKAMDE